MSSGEMQACLARLYVDEPLRRLFGLEPAAVLDGYFLSETERAALLGIDRAQLDDFAASLVTKRRKRVERAYPLLFALNPTVLRRCYLRFHSLFPARPGQAYGQDAIDFGDFMQETAPAINVLPAYAADIAKYEQFCFSAIATGIAAQTPGDSARTGDWPAMDSRPRLHPEVRLVSFTYDVAAIESVVTDAASPPPPTLAPSPCTILFNGAQILRINAPTKIIVELCDGIRTVRDVIADAESRLGATDLAAGVLQALGRLISGGMVTLAVAIPTASLTPSSTNIHGAARSRSYAAVESFEE